MATAELDIRLYDSTGNRKRLPHGWITGAEFEVGEKGGYQNGSLSVQANWEDLTLEGTEYADIHAFGNLVYRGYAFQPQQSIDDPEKWTISLYGLMDRLNGYLVRHCYCYASAVDISTVFEDIAAEYVTLAGRLPSLVIDTTGVSALGITLTEFCAKGKSVSQAFNQLVEMAPQQLIWGCDVDSNGDDRLYLYPRSSDTAYRYSVGKDVSAFVYPRDVTQVVNKVYVSGGAADPANLAPNASFENCSAVDDNENNLFTNAGFEDVYSVSSGAGYATGWTMTGNASTGAKAFVYPDAGGANLSHAGNVWVVLDYYSLSGMQVTAGTLAQTVQIGYPQKVRAGIWARQKTADGNTSAYRDFRIKIQAKDAGGSVLETFTSSTITPSTETWTQYTFEATPTNQSVTQITVTYEQITLFNGNQSTYHLLLDDATFVAAQVTADGWRVGTSVDAFFSDLDWHTTDQAKDGSYSLLAQATITNTGGYAELCTQTDNAIDVKPGKTYYFTAWALNDTGTAPTFKLGLRQFADSTQLQEDMGSLQTLSTANTWTRYEFSVTVGSNCNKLEPFIRLYNGGRVFFDAIMVTQGASVPQNVFYVGSTFEAVRSVTDYTSGDIGTDAANSITTYGIREKEESVEHIRTLDSLEAYCKSYFRAHAVPAIQAKLTLKGVTATLGLGGKVKLLNLPDAPEPLFPSRIRYRIGESFDAEVELNNERPDLALLLRKLTANVPKSAAGTAVGSNGGSTSRAGNGAVLTVAADAGTGLVGNVTLNSGRTAVLTQTGQDIQVDVRGRSVADLASLEAEANAIVFIADDMRGGFFYAYQTGTSANNGTTFAASNSGWVWKRVFQGAYNVLWFGAVGDGSTDDSAAIQAAVNAVPDGGTLLFPKTSSYYKVVTAITLGNGKGITLEGAGRDVELKQVSTDGTMFNVVGDNVTVRMLTLTGRQYLRYHPYNGGENCFVVQGADVGHKIYFFTVEHCDINTWGDCAFKMAFAEQIRIFDTKMRYLNDAGVLALSCNDGWIIRCEIDTIVGDDSPEGSVLSPNTSVYGVIISRSSDSDLTAYPRPENWIVAHNKVRNITRWEGLDTHGGKNIQFSNNNIYNVRTAITINYAQDAGGTQWLAPIACTASGNICDSGVTNGTRSLGIAVAGARNDFYIVTLSGSGANSCTFTWGGNTSSSVAGNASAGTIQTAIEGISGVGSGNVTVTADTNTANTFQILFTGTLSGTTTILTASGAAITKSPTKVYEAATGIIIVGNDLRGFGAEATQNSGAIYCTATENVNIVGNSIYRPSCTGIVLNTENKTFSITANNITDPWSNTGGNVGMGIRVYVATGIGNNTGVISSNNFVRSDLAGVSSVANRAIEVGNYSGNSVHIGLNTYVGFTYKILDTGNKGYTSFEERLQANGGLRLQNSAQTDTVDIDWSTTQKIAVGGSVLLTETSDKKLRKLEGAVAGWDSNSSLTKTVLNGARNRLALANNLSGFSISASTAISSGSLNNLWADDSNTATWTSLGSPITLTLTVPSWTSMQAIVISQHVTYYATTCLVEYSTNSGSSYSTFVTATGLTGGSESAIDTSTMAGTITNIKLTFSGFNSSTWQLFGIHWTHPNHPVASWALSRQTGGEVYGNVDLNANVASTFNTTANRRIRINATSTSDVLAYEMSENSGEGKRARIAMTGSGSSALMTIETDASSSTNRPNVSFRAGSTEWLLITTKGTNAGRVTIQTSGSNAGLMIVDALLYRDSSGVLRTSGSLTVDSVFKHSGSTLGFFNGTPATKQTLAAYTTNAQNSAYTGIDNAQAGTVYAKLTDLNNLRLAYENLRAAYDDERTKLQATTLVA